ncbi:hypothetical protein [Paenibacillus wenxiniae]|uniref:Uncharacterized protein n=1 Tax=Paenibacillus wenxiniae TaxID=1636843 RepID=A0ABW4RH33_9BACL
MNKLEKSIREKMKKEYRYPHDIEAIASAIYTLKVANEKVASEFDIKPILIDFLQSVTCSTYSDIVNITYQYIKQLAQHQGKLMDEEYQKIAHLFDSIHIFVELGIEYDDGVLEKSEKLILDVLGKRGDVLLPMLDDSKPWWDEIWKKYTEDKGRKIKMEMKR